MMILWDYMRLWYIFANDILDLHLPKLLVHPLRIFEIFEHRRSFDQFESVLQLHQLPRVQPGEELLPKSIRCHHLRMAEWSHVGDIEIPSGMGAHNSQCLQRKSIEISDVALVFHIRFVEQSWHVDLLKEIPSHLRDLLIFPFSDQSAAQLLCSEMADKYKARTIWCHTTDPEVRWQDRVATGKSRKAFPPLGRLHFL
jgi:hypothetical protein